MTLDLAPDFTVVGMDQQPQVPISGPWVNFTVTADDEEVRWDVSVIDDVTARLALAEFYRLPELLAGNETGVLAGGG